MNSLQHYRCPALGALHLAGAGGLLGSCQAGAPWWPQLSPSFSGWPTPPPPSGSAGVGVTGTAEVEEERWPLTGPELGPGSSLSPRGGQEEGCWSPGSSHHMAHQFRLLYALGSQKHSCPHSTAMLASLQGSGRGGTVSSRCACRCQWSDKRKSRLSPQKFPDTPGSLEGNTECPGTASSEPLLPS